MSSWWPLSKISKLLQVGHVKDFWFKCSLFNFTALWKEAFCEKLKKYQFMRGIKVFIAVRGRSSLFLLHQIYFSSLLVCLFVCLLVCLLVCLYVCINKMFAQTRILNSKNLETVWLEPSTSMKQVISTTIYSVFAIRMTNCVLVQKFYLGFY